MATKTLKVTRHHTTVRVQVGRSVESFDTDLRSRAEIIDWVYWIAVTNGIRLSHETIEDLLRENRVIV